MAEKTMVEKAGETVGVGIALASDVAGAVKTAVAVVFGPKLERCGSASRHGPSRFGGLCVVQPRLELAQKIGHSLEHHAFKRML